MSAPSLFTVQPTLRRVSSFVMPFTVPLRQLAAGGAFANQQIPQERDFQYSLNISLPHLYARLMYELQPDESFSPERLRGEGEEALRDFFSEAERMEEEFSDWVAAEEREGRDVPADFLFALENRKRLRLMGLERYEALTPLSYALQGFVEDVCCFLGLMDQAHTRPHARGLLVEQLLIERSMAMDYPTIGAVQDFIQEAHALLTKRDFLEEVDSVLEEAGATTSPRARWEEKLSDIEARSMLMEAAGELPRLVASR